MMIYIYGFVFDLWYMFYIKLLVNDIQIYIKQFVCMIIICNMFVEIENKFNYIFYDL